MRGSLRWASGPLWATSLAAAYRLLPPEKAYCSESPALEKRYSSQDDLAKSVGEFKSWLVDNGAQVSGLDFRPSSQPNCGMAVYAGSHPAWQQSWAQWVAAKLHLPLPSQPRSMAAFPLALALTGQRVAVVQPGLARALSSGAVDDRTAVILHLAGQRQAMEASYLAPWLRLLPQSFSTTLFWTDEEVDWLQGTTLYRATILRRQHLERAWRDLLPLASRLAEESGLPSPPTFDDFLWAYSIFWSRAIAFPCPPEADPGAPAATDSTGAPSPQEGIVPGLDFCNHAGAPAARWTVYGVEPAATGSGPTGRHHVHLVPVGEGGRVPVPGAEVTISYGDDKSNEELLFLYGFVSPDAAPAARLMMPLPLPDRAEDWTPRLRARMALLAARGLPSQVFLAAPPGASPADQGAAQAPLGALPGALLRTLEVFVLPDQAVAEEVAAAEAGASVEAEAQALAATRARLAEDPGLRLALTGVLVSLLQLAVNGMEGQEGEQALSADVELSNDPARMNDLTQNKRAALAYRIEQKTLAREWLVHAARLRSVAMTELRAGAASSE